MHGSIRSTSASVNEQGIIYTDLRYKRNSRFFPQSLLLQFLIKMSQRKDKYILKNKINDVQRFYYLFTGCFIMQLLILAEKQITKYIKIMILKI